MSRSANQHAGPELSGYATSTTTTTTVAQNAAEGCLRSILMGQCRFGKVPAGRRSLFARDNSHWNVAPCVPVFGTDGAVTEMGWSKYRLPNVLIAVGSAASPPAIG